MNGDATKRVTFDSSDLINLADQIDTLENTYKSKSVEALNSIHTYIDSSGNVNHQGNQLSGLPTFEQIYNGITQSQTVYNGNRAMIADNLPSNVAGWVNGNYIVGNNTDINNAYNRGYQAGLNYMTQHASIVYTYHQHVGNSSVKGGCYQTPVYHTHSGSPYAYGGCYTIPVRHQHSGSPSYGGGCYGGTAYHYHTNSCYRWEHRHDSSCPITGYWHHDYPCSSSSDSCPGHANHGCNDEPKNERGDLICGYRNGQFLGYQLNCGKTPGVTVDYYNPSCGRTPGVTIDRWALSCGKTAGVTIDEAHIVFP